MSAHPKRLAAVVLILALGLLAIAEAARATDLLQQTAAELSRQADRWIDDSNDSTTLPWAGMTGGPVPAALSETQWTRMRARVQGIVMARSDHAADAAAALAVLAGLARQGDLGALGDEHLLQALLYQRQWRSKDAEAEELRADQAYAAQCGPALDGAGCDARPWWRVLHQEAMRADTQGRQIEARALQQRALDLADRLGDTTLRAWSLSDLAFVSNALGDKELARRQMAQAERIAQDDESRLAWFRVRNNASRLASASAEPDVARHALDEALALARAQHWQRLEALVLGNLADAWVHGGHPRQALKAVEQALPLARRFGDLEREPLLLHNGGLARLALGQVRQGRADLDAALLIWDRAGAEGTVRTALREYADALAQAGEPGDALALYHREQALGARMDQANRQALQAELSRRYRSESEQRELARLQRAKALNLAELDNQRLTQRLWLMGGALLLAALSFLGLLVRRALAANRRLREGQALLQRQRECDVLTGLANRHRFQDLMAARADGRGFTGALMMLDVDHFKQVNDRHGHPGGDAVLIELARRLQAAVREDDLLCRWGGEEFLLFSPSLSADGLAALAERLLGLVGDEPLRLPDGHALDLTLSVGYARFPLPAHQLPMSWERAVNLVDMALYTAKSMGRDQAIGVVSLAAADNAALAATEAAFDDARLSGLVTLHQHSRVPDTRPAAAGTSVVDRPEGVDEAEIQ